ncbi:MAG: hypothetical protein C4543_04910 [Ignavibacteriales bacterium]|nr:MAG: hypothetical protein C4543_04910 [Ignavibacteriales bacterium]
MSFLYDLIPNNFINAFGWMMLHSIWQGALVAIILSIVFLFLNNKSAQLRYLVAVGAILFFTAMTIRTFVDYYNNPTQKIEQNNLVQSNAEEPQILNSSISTFENEESIYSQILFATQLYFNQHLPIIVALYLMGVLFFSLKLMGGFLYSQRIKHHRTNEPDENLTNIVNRFGKQIKIKQKVKLLESALVKVPVTIGYLKPVILFPIGLLSGMSSTQVEAVIVHELAHIKRADYLVNFLQSIIEIIFFYHPAVWWISSRIRDERENICDDISLELVNRPEEFAKALFCLNQYTREDYSLALSAIGNNNHLLRRIKRMTGETKHRTFRSKVYAASLMTLIIISLSIAACSTTNGESYYQDRSNIVYEEDNNGDHRYINTDRLDEENQTYIFYKRFRGEKSKWEATIDNGKLVDLYKDGDRVPTDEYFKYEDMILDEVDGITWELEKVHKDLASLKKDLKDIKIDLGENFAEDMKRIAEDIKIEFDSEEFKEQMKQLKEELKYLEKEDFPFNKEEFKREMSQLRDELSDMKFDIDFKWDSEEFKREMKDLSRELVNIKVDIDFSGLEESMRELRENMKDLDIDMTELKAEMKILKEFTSELKDELVSDGVIDSPGKLRRLEFEDDALYVNGKQVPDHLYKKYKEIYKEYYGEYPDGNSFSIHND